MKNTPNWYKAILFVALLFIGLSGFAQQTADSTQMWEITTVDGNKFSGFIISETASKLVFKTFAYGEITIPTSLVKMRVAKTKSEKTKVKPTYVASQPSVIKADSTTIWRIVTDEGFDFTGTISSVTDYNLVLKTEKFGDMNIDRRTIKSINKINADQMVHGEVWFENPQGSRYFYSPNGYGLRKNEGYYQNVWVLFNQVSYGFNDYFTMGVGTIPTVLFGADFLPIWITPKVSIPVIKDKLNLGAGIFAGSVIGTGSDSGTGFSLFYGVGTYGDRNKNVTIGAGYVWAGGTWAKKPTFTASTMIRTGKKGYFISENYVLSIEDVTVVATSLGGRTIWPRISLDYGLVIPFAKDLNQFIAIPWLGFVIPIGNQ